MTNNTPVSVRPQTIQLRALFPSANFIGCEDVIVSEITEHSTQCHAGTTFAAIPGSKYHGMDFLAEAIHRGATSILSDRPIPAATIPQCVVPNVRTAYAQICDACCGKPSRSVKVAGVTGTNGKTTVAWLIRAMLRQAGYQTGLLGTVEYDDGNSSEPSSLTTPDSKSFCEWLSRMANAGTTHAAVELSSHALHQGRVAGTQLAAAVLTNITQDHFDYHRNFTHYQASKARIFELLSPDGIVILNRDDPGCWSLREQIDPSRTVVSYSIKDTAEISARLVSESLSGLQFRLTVHGESQLCDTSLIGRPNIENCLAAAAVCQSFGISLKDIATAINDFPGAPGRLERIRCGQRFEVFVDYAHTDDALRRSLQSLQSITPGRVICVFGAGGDRDRSKRPLLGNAAQLADVPIITSDNPRSEDPDRIAADILQGFPSQAPPPLIELDRRQAIRRAIATAQPGDSVLIAGKGHENEQIFHDERIAFDDRRESRQAILERLAMTTASLRVGA